MTYRTVADLIGEDEPETPTRRAGHLQADELSPTITRHADGVAGLPETVSHAALATLLGLSTSRVSVLGKEGVVKKADRGRYLLLESVQGYAEWVRDNPRGRRIKDGDLHDEKLRLAKEQADKIALQNARARAELLDASEVGRRWVDYTAALRAALLAVPPRVAAQVGLDRTAAAALDAELRAALDRIADEGQKSTETRSEGGYTGESPSSGINPPEKGVGRQEAAE